MAIQQGIVAAEDLRPELDRVRWHPFQRALAATLADIVAVPSPSTNSTSWRCAAPAAYRTLSVSRRRGPAQVEVTDGGAPLGCALPESRDRL